MGIKIRESKLANGQIRLSLETNQAGKSDYENLRIFLYDKPKNPLEKEHNRKTKELAESIKAKRILEIQENRYNIHSGFKSQGSFIEYFKKLTRERKRKVITVHGIALANI